MRKHTTLNVDTDLLLEAQEVLGTSRATDTIHQALAEGVNRDKRRRLASRDRPGLTPEGLEKMRQNRTFQSQD